MDLRLKGHRAAVTGSSSGIGKAIARRLAAEGAAVVVHGRRAEEVRSAAGEINADATEDVAAASAGVTQALMEFEDFVLGGKRTTGHELERLSHSVTQAQMAFVNAARRSLDQSQQPLRSRLGGPPGVPATGPQQP